MVVFKKLNFIEKKTEFQTKEKNLILKTIKIEAK